MTSAIDLVKAGRPTPAQMAYALTQDRVIAPDVVGSLERYYLLYWTGRELQSRIVDGSIRIHGEPVYRIIFRDFTPTGAYKQPFVRLSFRAADKSYGLQAYVMVTAVSPDKCIALLSERIRKGVQES